MSKTHKFFHGQWPEAPWHKDVTEMSEERIAEALNFAEKYGGGSRKLSDTLQKSITPEMSADAVDALNTIFSTPSVLEGESGKEVFLVKLVTPYVTAVLPNKTYRLRYDTVQVNTTLRKALDFIKGDYRLIERDKFHFFAITLCVVDPVINSNSSEYNTHVGYYNGAGDRIQYPSTEIREWLESIDDR